jgi:hypothetical protein
MNASAGVRWELARVVAVGAPAKTLFLFAPAVVDPAQQDRLAGLVAPPPAGGATSSGFGPTTRPIGFYFEEQGRVRVEVHNAHRTATSYRTAFSHFLAKTGAT